MIQKKLYSFKHDDETFFINKLPRDNFTLRRMSQCALKMTSLKRNSKNITSFFVYMNRKKVPRGVKRCADIELLFSVVAWADEAQNLIG